MELVVKSFFPFFYITNRTVGAVGSPFPDYCQQESSEAWKGIEETHRLAGEYKVRFVYSNPL